MKQIITFVIILSLILLTPAVAESSSGADAIPFYIYNAASRFNIDATLMYAICRVESQCKSKAVNRNDGTPEQKALGIKIKSLGLFQLQVLTAKGLGFVDHRVTYTQKTKRGRLVKTKINTDFTKDLLKPEVNSFYAAKLLKSLYSKYRTTLRVISAFNAGHPIEGNSEYVNKVLREYAKLKLDKRF